MTVEEMKAITLQVVTIPVEIVFAYELINDYLMVVIDFPEQYIKDYDYVINGSYSKLSENYKQRFPISRDVFNEKKERVGKEYTIYYHIFNKTEWLKDFWMERLGLIELDSKLELWERPGKEDLVFDINKIST